MAGGIQMLGFGKLKLQLAQLPEILLRQTKQTLFLPFLKTWVLQATTAMTIFHFS
jgi:hypothetical protein